MAIKERLKYTLYHIAYKSWNDSQFSLSLLDSGVINAKCMAVKGVVWTFQTSTKKLDFNC